MRVRRDRTRRTMRIDFFCNVGLAVSMGRLVSGGFSNVWSGFAHVHLGQRVGKMRIACLDASDRVDGR